MRPGRLFGLFALPLLAAAWAAPALAAQDCAETQLQAGPNFLTGPDCTISWVDQGRLQTVTWRAVADDFQTAEITQTATGAILTAAALPDLIDIDQDGWLDIVTFTPVGMVNGTFDIFVYEPTGGTFAAAQSLYGHTLLRDPAGFIVVAGRSGPGTILRFYAAVNQRLGFRFEIDPYAPGRDGGPDCDISAVNSNDPAGTGLATGAIPDDPDLLRHYCDAEPTEDRRGVDLSEDPGTTDRVPAGAVFYCRLDDHEHAVTITRSADAMHYRYGPVGGTPELAIDRPADQVTVQPDQGAGPTRSGQISFDNGDYRYTAFYSFEPYGEGSDGIAPDPAISRGLVVTRGDDQANPVFFRHCLPGHSFDMIEDLN